MYSGIYQRFKCASKFLNSVNCKCLLKDDINKYRISWNGFAIQTKKKNISPGNDKVESNYGYSSLCLSNRKDIVKMGCDFKRSMSIAAKIVNQAPKKVQPYMKLMRIDKPIGSWLLFWPGAWSIALAAPAGAFPDLHTLTIFALGSFMMRGAGCTINDMLDKDIDAKIERTKSRPLVTGEISSKKALVFLGGQLTISLMLLLQLNWYSIILGASSLGLVFIYPLMKRITYYPQFVLGLTFNWGALLGWSAIHGSCDWSICLPLYAACISWTVLYDTIYAHQDRIDDILIGVKSTAIKFGDKTKICLAALGTSMISNLIYCGYGLGQSFPYYAAIALVSGHIFYQIKDLKIDDPSNCGYLFKSNYNIGWIIFCGIILGNLFKNHKKDKFDGKDVANVSANEVIKNVTLSL